MLLAIRLLVTFARAPHVHTLLRHLDLGVVLAGRTELGQLGESRGCGLWRRSAWGSGGTHQEVAANAEPIFRPRCGSGVQSVPGTRYNALHLIRKLLLWETARTLARSDRQSVVLGSRF
jgi:hypothetical protein